MLSVKSGYRLESGSSLKSGYRLESGSRLESGYRLDSDHRLDSGPGLGASLGLGRPRLLRSLRILPRPLHAGPKEVYLHYLKDS